MRQSDWRYRPIDTKNDSVMGDAESFACLFPVYALSLIWGEFPYHLPLLRRANRPRSTAKLLKHPAN